MNTKKLMTLLLAVVLVLSLAACGAKGGDHMDGMDNEPKNAEEATAMHKELTAQEAAILAENTALWEKVFMAADKGKIMMEDGKNYGDFLLETINAAKDQFSADELKLLQSEAEKIRDIGNKLAALEEKYPEIVQKSLDSDMNMPTDKDMDTMPDSGSKDNKTDSGSTGSTPDNGSTGNKTDSGSTGSKTDDSSLQKFPAFEGKDLDGNTVKSSDLFSGKAVTAAAREGDPAALECYEQLTHWLGVGLADMCALLDPEVVVIAGGLAEAGDILLTPARKAFTANLTAGTYRPAIPVVLAEGGQEAGLVGAADLARQP